MCSLPTASISCTVRVSKIPYTALAEELVEFLNSNIGPDCVFACKIHTEKLNWKSRGFGFVQFETEEAASKAVELSRKCKLRFQQGLLQIEFEESQIVDRPHVRVHCSSFHIGYLMAGNMFCALWSSKTAATIELYSVKEKVFLFLDSPNPNIKYKLTWKLTSLEISGSQKEDEIPNGVFFLYLEAKYAPKIYRKITENTLKRASKSMSDRYSFFRDKPRDEDHPWCRYTDFTANQCIRKSSSYYLGIPVSEGHNYLILTKKLGSVQAFKISEDMAIQKTGDSECLQDTELKQLVLPKLKEGLVQINRCVVTPTKIYLLGPEIEVSNRVTRHYMDSMEFFLRIHFADEDMSALSARDLEESVDTFLKSRVRSERTEIYNRIGQILEEGIEVGGKKYEFLAFSSSQLREHSVWMFAPSRTTTAHTIRSWMGNFTNFKNVASCAARMGQSFSASKKGPDVYACEIEEILDIERISGGVKYCFSDGIGKISIDFAREVAMKCGYECSGREAPSAFQIRYGGYKGVVAIDPASSFKLSLRPSMKKFESKLIALDVLEWTRFLPCYLNRQVIMLLSTLGIEDHIFEQMQRERISSLDGVLKDEVVALRMLQASCTGREYHRVTMKMLQGGYSPRWEPFLYNMLQEFRAAQIHQICKKSKILVPNGRVLMGCLDETAYLSYGEVFVKISMTELDHNNSCVIQGKVVVAKNPCLHSGDIRVLQAVDSPNLQHMVDCIVFPQKGSRPHPNECSGSDLDGDLYFVTWDERLIPSMVDLPMDYYPPNSISLDHPPTLEEIRTYFLDYMSNDSLGTIANAHVVFADKEPEKARSWQCKELAELASVAVDFPKTGVAAILPKCLRPHAYPDFLEKRGRKTYVSSGIIGKLYRGAREASRTDATRSRNDVDQFYDKDLTVKGFEKYVEEALVYKKRYNEKLASLMEFYGVPSEAEILMGFFTRLHPTMSNTSKRIEDRIQEAVSALQTEARHWFQSTQGGGGHDNEEYAIASAWYHATYHPEFLHERGCLPTPFFSFPWVNCDKLLQIKRFNRLVKENSHSGSED